MYEPMYKPPPTVIGVQNGPRNLTHTTMKKFLIIDSGVRSKSQRTWVMIEQECGEYVEIAFLLLKKASKLKIGDSIELPETKVDKLEWK